ncbi:MAG TPA: hypothetical protein G4O13_05560 [Dehalococcoidia bacterium]|nr:hypothetical protein [Dehalococcoidia bacterium]
MTLRRQSEVIEIPEGSGQVFREGKAIAEVGYRLYIEAGTTIAKSFKGDRQTRVAHKSVRGHITVLDGDLMPGGSHKTPFGPFSLAMQDGREFDFYVDDCATDPESGHQELRISGAGSKL